jgi:hypothetical protein
MLNIKNQIIETPQKNTQITKCYNKTLQALLQPKTL